MSRTTFDRRSTREGSVEVARLIAAPIDRVFAALVDPAHTRQWFGALSTPLVDGVTATLDFEDGDFFAIEDVQVAPPARLSYRWRFLGLSALDSIEWHLEAAGDRTRVAVVDTDPLRAAEWNEALREGWRDFTSRLVRYAETGENARYAWRHELDGGVEIALPPAAACRLLVPEVLPRWLPSGAVPQNGASWDVDDGVQPERVCLHDVQLGERLHFTVDHPAWNAVTDASVSVRARGHGSMLSFSHSGWEHLAGGDEYQKQQRRRFAALWVSALGRARQLAESEATGN